MKSDLNDLVAKANLAAYDHEGAATYIDGAPHLKHPELRRLYADLLVTVFETSRRLSSCPRVLDLGAGEGSVTLPMLELGAHVTAVDISPDQIERLRRKCEAYSSRLEMRCEDIAETLRRDDGLYDIVVANSFLHHVPDYFGLLQQLVPRLSGHGQFFSFQDPMFYREQRVTTRAFDRAAYAFWRVTKADVIGGLRRRWRRSRGRYSAESAYDNAEYHVLRDGVDQGGVVAFFEQHGFQCRLESYFSTQSRIFQLLGASLNVKNTFALIASRLPCDRMGS